MPVLLYFCIHLPARLLSFPISCVGCGVTARCPRRICTILGTGPFYHCINLGGECKGRSCLASPARRLIGSLGVGSLQAEGACGEGVREFGPIKRAAAPCFSILQNVQHATKCCGIGIFPGGASGAAVLASHSTREGGGGGRILRQIPVGFALTKRRRFASFLSTCCKVLQYAAKC